MLDNRSIPNATVIPVVVYPDVTVAADWLARTFGFTIRLRIGNHRIQMNVGEGGIILREPRPHEVGLALGIGHSTHVRVPDVDAHYTKALLAGLKTAEAPQTYPYGERQYIATDPAGHSWTFTQTIADIDPADWVNDF